ncbi:MAG TPA: hypothetical protein VK983_04940 [Candidatus Limnocylindrales bacterium]|nr:hypothetical protein [Candidatus Limnocylindrales bacterium]
MDLMLAHFLLMVTSDASSQPPPSSSVTYAYTELPVNDDLVAAKAPIDTMPPDELHRRVIELAKLSIE